MAAEGGDVVRFTYTGADGEVIPRDATHVFVDAAVIPDWLFQYHRKIVEVICHNRVKYIGHGAFRFCHRLRRVIMRGVKRVEEGAFFQCKALTSVECGKLKIIGLCAFCRCYSLRNINLPSTKIVQLWAFDDCDDLASAQFSSKLERIDEMAFSGSTSLKRITIPLKDGVITRKDIFLRCGNLKQVDLVVGGELHDSIAALQFSAESINQSLRDASKWGDNDYGGKASAIRSWLRLVLHNIPHYKAAHLRSLDAAATTLEMALPRDIVMDNVLSFLELPPCRLGEEDYSIYSFALEDREDAEDIEGAEDIEDAEDVENAKDVEDEVIGGKGEGVGGIFCCLRRTMMLLVNVMRRRA